ncbi:GTP-binding protein [Zobellia galactanivorans]|uniref:CobW-like nucleotide binding protein n=1 Tax=Zobellia galactanivorans (strain DSM 12802 / CCUG 47099 / CIP 106680 / NCIMB 13871 / Dsij) TaxID=63186 RepID=G0L6M0_ZOBGA|nr:GTP-binding protein [Zobellia galactanivorans]CAZ98505.1 CobW-like nucleotide binding protein [Zobellia galactanivorans]
MEAIITVVGFLGAGKTTLLKHLVENFSNNGWYSFVILNDYENANMDAQQFAKLIELNSIKPLSGSCICCSGIVDLRNTVNRIPERKNGITLIEANGTSDACSLMEFLGVGLNDRFLPPIQISVVDIKNWQKRGEHNELEANQIQVSSLLVLTHLKNVSENRKAQVINELKKLNPLAKVVSMDSLDVLLLPELLPSKNTAQKFDHQKAHWASCSVDLPDLPNAMCIHSICSALPKSILRVKGCTKIGDATDFTYFERIPNGEVHIRPFNGIPITGSKLLSIGPGSKPSLLEKVIKESIVRNA